MHKYPAKQRHGPGPGSLILLGIAGLSAAAWLHFRRLQPDLDARTRDRLAPRSAA